MKRHFMGNLHRACFSPSRTKKSDLGSQGHTAGHPFSGVLRVLLMYLLFAPSLTSSLVGMLVVLGLSQTPVSFLSGGSVWIASVSSEGRRCWFCAVRAVGFCSLVMTARVSAGQIFVSGSDSRRISLIYDI